MWGFRESEVMITIAYDLKVFLWKTHEGSVSEQIYIKDHNIISWVQCQEMLWEYGHTHDGGGTIIVWCPSKLIVNMGYGQRDRFCR